MTQDMIDDAISAAREDERKRRARVEALVNDLAEPDKVRENRLRRAAARQGLKLVKSRRRDPRALDFGAYWITNRDDVILTPENGMDLDRIEAYLFPDQFRSA